METNIKTDVDIIQELLAIHSSRKEACEKISDMVNDATFKEKLNTCHEQSEQFIKALMDELSLHGDAVLSDVNRNNSYLNAWKNVSAQMDGMDEHSLQESFASLEKYILDYYREITALRSDEPGSLDEILIKQMHELEATL